MKRYSMHCYDKYGESKFHYSIRAIDLDGAEEVAADLFDRWSKTDGSVSFSVELDEVQPSRLNNDFIDMKL